MEKETPILYSHMFYTFVWSIVIQLFLWNPGGLFSDPMPPQREEADHQQPCTALQPREFVQLRQPVKVAGAELELSRS